MNRLLAKFHDTKIPMVEIFHSISGEGVSAGNLTTFVRAAGCDLRCTWCDTKYSFKETGHDVPMMQPQEIMNQVALFGCSEVICTGGEPLEIEKTKRYLPAYLQQSGYRVRIETSGGSPLYSSEELLFFNLTELSRPVYTMDIKCPSSGMESRNLFSNIEQLDVRDELKFVVANQHDLDYAMEVIAKYQRHFSQSQLTLNFSPVFDAIELPVLVEFLKLHNKIFEEKRLKVRLNLQIHKFIWPPHQRGV
ncbi:MAG: radical SAM protein [Bacteroidota bacterium]|nr:MAG: radical SAM protein [Bacteroidota bacterium]